MGARRPLLAEPVTVAAVDLGASAGRVIVGLTSRDRLELREVARFRNIPVTAGGTLHWDILRVYRGILDGLGAAARDCHLASIGIDSWGVDYGLLDSDGALLGNPVHYRDGRTAGAIDQVLAKVSAADLYATTGIQQLPINTLCQLATAAGTPQLRAASTLLLIPDLLGYWLTGHRGAEITNASTTQLLDVRSRTWATALIRRAGIDPRLLPPLRQPGDLIGETLPDVAPAAGLSKPLPVIAVGSHDTASAVASVPARGPDFAYVSCGTWSLVGMELEQPVLTADSRDANFSNELGIDGTIRYLRNIMGLWLLQESVRAWSASDRPVRLEALLAAAAAAPALAAVIDPNDPAFLPPGNIPARIADACHLSGQRPPADRAETVRCILDSLALAYRRAIRELQELTGRQVDTVHIVGGGARNALLCQLTADACGLPVVAGPAEAAALGNILVQLRALGSVPPDMEGMRALVRATQPLRRFYPATGQASWLEAERRLRDHPASPDTFAQA